MGAVYFFKAEVSNLKKKQKTTASKDPSSLSRSSSIAMTASFGSALQVR
jgi:hypothetical protein